MLKYTKDDVKKYFRLSDTQLHHWERTGIVVPLREGMFSRKREFYSEFQLGVIEQLLNKGATPLRTLTA